MSTLPADERRTVRARTRLSTPGIAAMVPNFAGFFPWLAAAGAAEPGRGRRNGR
jgi:hypothetical protein